MNVSRRKVMVMAMIGSVTECKVTIGVERLEQVYFGRLLRGDSVCEDDKRKISSPRPYA